RLRASNLARPARLLGEFVGAVGEILLLFAQLGELLTVTLLVGVGHRFRQVALLFGQLAGLVGGGLRLLGANLVERLLQRVTLLGQALQLGLGFGLFLLQRVQLLLCVGVTGRVFLGQLGGAVGEGLLPVGEALDLGPVHLLLRDALVLGLEVVEFPQGAFERLVGLGELVAAILTSLLLGRGVLQRRLAALHLVVGNLAGLLGELLVRGLTCEVGHEV